MPVRVPPGALRALDRWERSAALRRQGARSRAFSETRGRGWGPPGRAIPGITALWLRGTASLGEGACGCPWLQGGGLVVLLHPPPAPRPIACVPSERGFGADGACRAFSLVEPREL